MSTLLERARELQVGTPATVSTPYVNTIPPEEEPFFPGDEDIERRIRAFIRWNAAVMVVKANKHADGIGGHLATFASSAALYEVGFNHFFRGKDDGLAGDHIYFQGHAAPGIYARAFLEGRLTEEQLDHFRREVDGKGLSSYPHPRLMPDFWEYPTVSMGLGPLCSIYHARFNKYLHNRKIEDTSGSRVWCFIGDGECDEPETLGSISLAAREGLDNLTWVVNCNLQRLDGPVRGNGKIIQELEAVFRGAGWNVIKVIWGGKWDELLMRDVDGVLLNRMNETVDGEFQRYAVESGAYAREHFFGPDPRLRKLVEHLSDEEIRNLPRGGHDYRKLYAAYKAATEQPGAPTVILAKTIKGWTLGPDVEGRNATHQIKKMTTDQLKLLRERLHLQDEVPEDALADDKEPPYIQLDEDSRDPPVHARPAAGPRRLAPAPRRAHQAQARAPGQGGLRRGARRLRQAGGVHHHRVHPPAAQPLPRPAVRSPRGADHPRRGAHLRHGLAVQGVRDLRVAGPDVRARRPRAAALLQGEPAGPDPRGGHHRGRARWPASSPPARATPPTACRWCRSSPSIRCSAGSGSATSSGRPATRGPAASCSAPPPGAPRCSARASSTRTATASCWRRSTRSPRPTTRPSPTRWPRSSATGCAACGSTNEDVIYYLTLYNENQVMPPMPDDVAKGVIEGLYRWAEAPDGPKHRATILFSGSANLAAREAQSELLEHYDVAAELWSATSYKRLREQALTTERWNRLHPDQAERTPRVTELLDDGDGPIVAVTDFMKAVPDQIARWVPAGRRFVPLGTDGFGRSDTREALRRHFETDAPHVVVATLAALADERRGEARGRHRRHRPLRHRPRARRSPPRLTPP